MFDYWRVYPFMFHEYFIIALLYHQYEPLLLFPMITIPLYPMNIPLYSYSFPICLQENPAGPGNPWYPTPSPWNIPFNPDKTAFLLVNQLITSINIMSHRFPIVFQEISTKTPHLWVVDSYLNQERPHHSRLWAASPSRRVPAVPARRAAQSDGRFCCCI